jgi:hypothetical protein
MRILDWTQSLTRHFTWVKFTGTVTLIVGMLQIPLLLRQIHGEETHSGKASASPIVMFMPAATPSQVGSEAEKQAAASMDAPNDDQPELRPIPASESSATSVLHTSASDQLFKRIFSELGYALPAAPVGAPDPTALKTSFFASAKTLLPLGFLKGVTFSGTPQTMVLKGKRYQLVSDRTLHCVLLSTGTLQAASSPTELPAAEQVGLIKRMRDGSVAVLFYELDAGAEAGTLSRLLVFANDRDYFLFDANGQQLIADATNGLESVVDP